MTGVISNDWVDGMKPDEYKWVSVVGKVVQDGDENQVKFIFDEIPDA